MGWGGLGGRDYDQKEQEASLAAVWGRKLRWLRGYEDSSFSIKAIPTLQSEKN